MPPVNKTFKFIRRVDSTPFLADQVIGSGGGTVTNIPIAPDKAIEVQLDDGSTIVLLGYLRK